MGVGFDDVSVSKAIRRFQEKLALLGPAASPADQHGYSFLPTIEGWYPSLYDGNVTDTGKAQGRTFELRINMYRLLQVSL